MLGPSADKMCQMNIDGVGGIPIFLLSPRVIYPAGRMLGTSSDHEVKEASKKELIEIFKVLEGELGDKPYYGGDTFGFVDVALIPYYSFFHTFETLGNFIFEAECPKLVSWAKRCMQKTSVSKSLCDQHKVYEVVLELKKKLGVE
ncbi:hypothetical protein Pint_31267 [Pistacia integerrima]|uniref:Uncharacterized protein n=1 Tax=Pistacia integerrima TaxID=434235 RepID=A0ACC0XLY1_9ROSI|nr:hypothetical protein Pint_31267 [Pistacia integerrima]